MYYKWNHLQQFYLFIYWTTHSTHINGSQEEFVLNTPPKKQQQTNKTPHTQKTQKPTTANNNKNKHKTTQTTRTD